MYRKFKITKASYVLHKTLVLSIICDKCAVKMKKYLKKKINRDIKNSWFN